MILKHDGYVAEVVCEDGDDTMRGTTINTRAVLRFSGRSLEELRKAFAETIRRFRTESEERGGELEITRSGLLSLHVPLDLHRRISERAADIGVGVNQFIIDRLQIEAPAIDASAPPPRTYALSPEAQSAYANAKARVERAKNPDERSVWEAHVRRFEMLERLSGGNGSR